MIIREFSLSRNEYKIPLYYIKEIENFEEHICKFHLCESTSVDWETTNFIIPGIRCVRICFERLFQNEYDTFFGSDKNCFNCI